MCGKRPYEVGFISAIEVITIEDLIKHEISIMAVGCKVWDFLLLCLFLGHGLIS